MFISYGLGVQVFGVNDMLRAQKMAKIQHGVKPDIFKRAAQKMAKILVGVKFQHFGLLFGQKSASNS